MKTAKRAVLDSNGNEKNGSRKCDLRFFIRTIPC